MWTLDHSKKEDLLISGGNDNLINLWDTKTNKLIETLKDHNEVVKKYFTYIKYIFLIIIILFTYFIVLDL